MAQLCYSKQVYVTKKENNLTYFLKYFLKLCFKRFQTSIFNIKNKNYRKNNAILTNLYKKQYRVSETSQLKIFKTNLS